MTMMLLNEYILNVDLIRQQKNNKLLKEAINNQTDSTLKNSGKVFMTSSNPDKSALYSVMRVVTEKSSMEEEEVKHLLQIFKNTSSDKTVDGLMDRIGFYSSIDSIGAPVFVKEQLFRVFDQNGDGFLDLQDYSIGLSIYLNGKFDEKLKLIFRILDVDRNCQIGKEELRRMFRIMFSCSCKVKISDRELECKVETAMRTCDLNGDGSLDCDEFRSEFQKSPHMLKLFNYIFSSTLINSNC